MIASILTFLRTKVFGNIWFIAIFIAPLLVLVSAGISSLGVFNNLENKLLDNKFNARGVDTTLKQNSSVILISINDAAQKVVGNMPWPRDYYARIVQNLNRAGAKVVAFDLLLDEVSSEQNDNAFRNAITEYGNVVLAGRYETGEKRIEYTSIKELPLQNIFTNTPRASTGIVFVRNDADGIARRYHPASEYLGRELLSFGYAIAKVFLNTPDSIAQTSDGDFSFAGKNIPTFYDGESVLLNYYGPSSSFQEYSAEQILDDRTFFSRPETEKFREAMRQTGMDSLALIKDESLRSLWAEDLFDDAGDPAIGLPPLGLLQSGKLKGKICIIGPMYPESKDLFVVPMYSGGREDQNQMYGVELHATAVQNFLDGKFITPADGSLVLLALLAICYLLFALCVSVKRIKITDTFTLYLLSGLTAAAVSAGLFSLYVFISGYGPLPFFLALPVQQKLIVLGAGLLVSVLAAYFFHRGNSSVEFITEVGAIALSLMVFWLVVRFSNILFEQRVLLKLVPFAAAVLLAYIVSIVYQYLTESRQKKVIRGYFNAYLDPEVVNQLISNPNQFRLGGEKRELTMLFSDIKGFTNISEALPPEELVVLLNEYLGAMTDIVLKSGGTLDKYVGDAVVAFWGAPIAMEDHAKRGCWAAVEMQEKLAELRAKWKAEGRPELRCRIGVNTGKVIVGNMGSQARFSYTAMGDAMNLASRLEAANKAFGTYILISEYTNEHVQEFCQTREIADITVQGKAQPIRVFEVVGKKIPGQRYDPLPPAETAGRGVQAIAKE
ncbi:MAG: adenylate/guanylate cyclase domain-containing protein [Rhizobacter sp.]|nr:adenylate/guanylate cyclase domain-containing protein [Chlorobiales bacterium]